MKSPRHSGRVLPCVLAMSLLLPAASPAASGVPFGIPSPLAGAGTFRDAGRGHVDYRTRRFMASAPCTALKGAKFPDHTQIDSAIFFPATSTLPAFCKLLGTSEGTIAFEIAMPIFWNGRLYVYGNGGFAGEPFSSYDAQRDAALVAGFATAHTNTGHYGKGPIPLFDASWALNDPTAVVNWANRSVHVVTVAAKLVVKAFYSRTPDRSYYEGCSTGGQQAFTEAQKYPNDFDGIVGGDPARAGLDTFLIGVWSLQWYDKAPINATLMARVANSIMARCDALDGLRDGIISDPRRCRLEPKIDGAGLTPKQLTTLEQLYAGARNSYGQLEVGPALGSEFAFGLVGILIPTNFGPPYGVTSASYLFTSQFLRYIAPFPQSGNIYSIPTFNFDVDPYKLGAIASVYDADNADLSAFARHGGRFVGYHGWADPLITPYATVAYTESTFQVMGYAQARNAFREFFVPGMGHCQGTGYGANTFDALTPVVDWVEGGVAPESIRATRFNGSGVAFTRLLCAYPEEAVYMGGNPKSSNSFACQPGLTGLPFPPIGRPAPN